MGVVMSELLDQQNFWHIVKYLVQMKGTNSFDKICQDLEITKNQLGSFINFLKEVDYHFDYSVIDGKQSLTAPSELPVIKFDFNLIEWLQFQAHFPAFESMQDKPFHSDIRDKFTEVENKYSQHDLFEPLETLQQVLEVPKMNYQNGQENTIISFLEESILDKKHLRVQLQDKSFLIYPHRIVYLEGKLSLVAEDVQDKCLLNISLDQIQNLNEESSHKKNIFSKYEVSEFILGLRDVTGHEVRLVLKVYSYDKFDPKLEHHFLGKPCMITNSNGDAIWAASIEPSEKIFEWLEFLGSDVEILDPIELKKEFLKV